MSAIIIKLALIYHYCDILIALAFYTIRTVFPGTVEVMEIPPIKGNSVFIKSTVKKKLFLVLETQSP